MFKSYALGFAALMAVAMPANAYQVYPGCAAPPPVSVGKKWFVDPANGKTPAAGGLGTQDAPWNSLQGVLAGQWGAAIVVPGYTRPLLSIVPYNHATPTGRVDAADLMGAPPVNPGDSIELMTGNYGDVGLGNYQLPTVNTDWITVEAAPGQKPVFDTLAISLTSKWVFNGIKVQSLLWTNKNTRALLTVNDAGTVAWSTHDIVFTNMDISTDDNTAAWTQAQWVAQGRSGVSFSGSAGDGTNGQPLTSCISMTGSHVHAIRTGVYLGANSTLFTNNEVDHFGDDALEWAANDLAITNNYEHDNFDVGDGNHEDAMQGVIGALPKGVAFNRFSNILIDSNKIIRATDPTILFPTYLQGIDAFDSDWTGMTVTNNVIVTASCWGIDLSSQHNALVAGNTVADDLLVSTPGCTTWLAVGGPSHEGLPSSNVRVTNNLAEHFIMGSQGDTGMVWDNNVATNSYQSFSGWNFTTGAWSYGEKVGTDATGNVTPAKAMDLTTVFKVWSPATRTYDMRVLATSGVLGHGSSLPATDILGSARAAAAPVCTTPAYTPVPGAYSLPL
jgi:hypothetical protein